RAEFGVAMNELVKRGEIKAPIVIGRDHLDAGSVASPNRETEGMIDGSDAIADWPLLNALINTAAGASWISIHNGGGVGIGYSQGRDENIITQIGDAIKSTDGVSLLDVDPGATTNRTVVTFVGNPEAAVEAAFRGIKKAAELIDMRKHKGAHPRMGATDVCPFIPVSNVSWEEAIECATKLGKRVGDELGIPVYLYEKAANDKSRSN